MTVLARPEILKKIKSGEVKIEPFDKDNIGPASIDLTLSDEFRMYKGKKKIDLNEDTNHLDYTTLTKGSIVLKPGDFVTGITKEKITLPENVCGFLSGRSRFARLGILVHATASLIQPGISNRQVLEIKNVSPNNLTLRPGLKICQLALMEMKGKAKYEGKFSKQ